MPLKIALYQPDIAQNVGTVFRMGACLGVEIDIIEPCGFPFDDRKFKRSAMDYMQHVRYQKHASWEHFKQTLKKENRLIMLSSKATESYYDFAFSDNDILVFGRESAGIPAEVAAEIPHKLTIPMQPEMRSLNVAISAAVVTGEALRQLRS